jgi:hypothetical protein
MRERLFRSIALVIGLLGLPSIVFQVVQQWPPALFQLQFFGLQAVVMGAFIAYGLGYLSSQDRT